jgi:hypothetical protein
MSRCNDWTNALSGLSNTIKSNGIKLNKSNYNIEIKIINKYCNLNKIKGSLSQRILETSQQFNQFKQYLKQENEKSI